jgi:hypothetical protein
MQDGSPKRTIYMDRNILQKVDVVHEVLVKHIKTRLRYDGIAHGTMDIVPRVDFYG